MNRPKGTKDIYGNKLLVKSKVLEVLKKAAKVYNFKEIETPIFERQEVFVKSVGESSDIVSKEMYTFDDKKGRKMVLRPEGTAGVIRAYVENKIYANNDLNKLFYIGPMFRYENPQKGRQRQFTQMGVEMFGEKSPYSDAEVILMGAYILDSLNLDYELEINSLGDKETRDNYSKALKEYLNKYYDQLTNDSQKRLEVNPLRILDDKIDSKKDFVKNAPKISDFYSDKTKEYFETLTSFLKDMNIDFKINHNLVRGLDYYTDTAFEFISKADSAGSQSTLIGGGRYENLVKSFGGPDISGIGFGIGIERIINDVEASFKDEDYKESIDVYVLNIASDSQKEVAKIVQMIRKDNLFVEWNQKSTKLQKAFIKADKTHPQFQVIIGDNEIKSNKVVVKYNDIKEEVPINELVNYLKNNKKGN